MNQKELTKTFMVFKLKKTLWFPSFSLKNSALQGLKLEFALAIPALNE